MNYTHGASRFFYNVKKYFLKPFLVERGAKQPELILIMEQHEVMLRLPHELRYSVQPAGLR